MGNPYHHGKECVYTIFDAKGNAACGIESHRKENRLKKPFPAIIPHSGALSEFAGSIITTAICDSDALGRTSAAPVYQFVKEADSKIWRKWYAALEQVAQERGNLTS